MILSPMLGASRGEIIFSPIEPVYHPPCVYSISPYTRNNTGGFAKEEFPLMCNPQLYLSLNNTLAKLQKYFDRRLISQRKKDRKYILHF